MPATRKLRIITCDVAHSGEKNGREWTLYKVVATDLDGRPVEQELKSFSHLAGEVEVEIEEQKHEKYGTSYLLKLPGGGGGGGGGGGNPGARLGPKVDELRSAVDMLEEKLRLLTLRVTGVESVLHKEMRAEGLTPPAPQPEPAKTGGGTFDDDDIPF